MPLTTRIVKEQNRKTGRRQKPKSIPMERILVFACVESVPHIPAGRWWSQAGSNRRPPACKAGALPAELWPLNASLRCHVRRCASPPLAPRALAGTDIPCIVGDQAASEAQATRSLRMPTRFPMQDVTGPYRRSGLSQRRDWESGGSGKT